MAQRADSSKMGYRSRYRQYSGLIDPTKFGAYIQQQRAVLREELETGKVTQSEAARVVGYPPGLGSQISREE